LKIQENEARLHEEWRIQRRGEGKPVTAKGSGNRRGDPDRSSKKEEKPYRLKGLRNRRAEGSLLGADERRRGKGGNVGTNL